MFFLFRPNFTLEMDSKEEFFIELILSRHARKLLSNKCLKDLGLFAAHLEFNLSQWMSRERSALPLSDAFLELFPSFLDTEQLELTTSLKR